MANPPSTSPSTTTTDGPLPVSSPRSVFVPPRRSPAAPIITFGLLLTALACVTVLAAVATFSMQRSTIRALEERIERLEKTEQYRGKDADGNEVWSAQVMEIPLPPPVERPAP